MSVVAAKHGAAQLYHGCDRCIAEYIVEAGAALFNTHFAVINTYLGVISGVKRTDRATHRLRKRHLVVSAGCSVNFMPGLNLS